MSKAIRGFMDALMNTMPGGGGKPETMTSLEISEVVNSAHADVRRSIERLAERGVITLPPTAEVSNPRSGPKTISVYQVSERESYIVVAQLSPEFTASLVDFWQKNRHTSTPAIPMTPAELVLQNAQALVTYERRQAEQQAEIADIRADVEEIRQTLTAFDNVPPNGELVTHLRPRIRKMTGLSFDVINIVLDKSPYSLSPKFGVRNHHENADGSINYGYWKREVNAVFREFVKQCRQVTPTLCEHDLIDFRFKLVKRGAK